MMCSPCEDIARVHAFLSLEEVRNRRAVVNQGDHVDYDVTARNRRKTDSELSPSSVEKNLFAQNIGIGQRQGTFRNQISKVVATVLKYSVNSVPKGRSIGSCFKPKVTDEVHSATDSEDDLKGPFVMSEQTQHLGRALGVQNVIENDISEITAEESSQDSLRTTSMCDRASSATSNENGRVKSQLPCQEPAPYVESGFVKRAIRSYLLNVVRAGGESWSVEDEVDPVANVLGENSSLLNNTHHNTLELTDHSMVSSGSGSPVSDAGKAKMRGNLEEHCEAIVDGTDNFKNGYVAQVAESFDYLIDHEHGRGCNDMLFVH